MTGKLTMKQIEQQWIALAGLVTIAFFAADAPAQSRTALAEARNRMVDEEIVAAGVKSDRVVRSMRTTPRHEFVPMSQRKYAYYDMALPIGESQTISPPFVVATMTEAIDPQPNDKVLEIGTGSGYQAAVLGPLVAEVYTIEIVRSLGRARAPWQQRLIGAVLLLAVCLPGAWQVVRTHPFQIAYWNVFAGGIWTVRPRRCWLCEAAVRRSM